MIQLILGGARSGKSSLAEQLAEQSGKEVSYVATARAQDEEMRARIARHQSQRPLQWPLIEEPLLLSELLAAQTDSNQLLLVDCLTLWLSNHLHHPQTTDLHQLTNSLCDALQSSDANIILVSNEVGLGIVPMGEITRQFVDHAGWLNQAVARIADRVILVTAGLPQVLKGQSV